MSAVRFTRAATRATAQLRAPAQRRFASTQNEFIKERQHIKEHAAGTTELWKKISLYGVAPALSPPVPTPTGSGASTGSTGLTCLLWRSAPSTLTRTSVPRTTSGVTETRLSSGTTRSTTTTRIRPPKYDLLIVHTLDNCWTTLLWTAPSGDASYMFPRLELTDC
ncbi:hypothetical protein NXS19_005718 [Fusarium pseudograminearum]|nr:hypothetical protein NXS19_005718 [Fusarium pseudograminearum]